jgi:putative DNA primase/helicase
MQLLIVEVLSAAQRRLASQSQGRRVRDLLAQRVIRAVMDACKRATELHVSDDDWNHDGNLLVCPNGTVDLRTGAMRPNRPSDLATNVTTVDYDPEARHPLWEAFLRDVTRGCEEHRSYLHRFAGYCALGYARLKAIHISYGCGDNGKSIWHAALRAVLGEGYHLTLPGGTLLPPRDGGGDKPRADLLHLRGSRMANVYELPSGAYLDERLLKTLASGGVDQLAVRGLFHQKPTSFVPTASVTLVTNHRPMVAGSDNGLWSRLRVLPWPARFVPAAEADGVTSLVRILDYDQRLVPTYPAVLAWIVRGAQRFLAEGLETIPAIDRATAAYRAQMDMTGTFITTHFDRVPGARIPSRALYEEFVRWSVREEYPHHPRLQDFVARLSTMGLESTTTREGRTQVRAIDGLRWKPEAQDVTEKGTT